MMTLQIQSPYLREGYLWLRGNLHTHTTRSDGQLPPEETIAAYESRGYDFLALSDHDKLVPPEAFQAHTKLTLLPADEVSANGPHILAVGIQEVIPPDADRQKVIDAANAQGGFAILNHPNWLQHFNHCPQEKMEQWTNYAGIEIYNGIVEYLEGSALATDRWDRLLGSGRRAWGYAHDDFHISKGIERGWNVVQAADRSPQAILDALRSGRFYASTGVAITRIEVREDVLFVAAPDAQRIRFIGAWGRELFYADSGEAEYPVEDRAGGYVRVECYGRGVKAAWTQPFFLAGQTA
jgi:hypothetical protein